jgi:uncharacterized membrane protein YvbJ
MAYCSKCGTKNEDDAEYCKKCGLSLSETKKGHSKDDRCEEECLCGEKSKSAPIIWGIIIILVGIWFLFEIVIKNTSLKDSLPSYLVNIEWWWIIGVVIVIAIIGTGFKMIVKR